MPTFHHDAIAFNYVDEGKGLPVILQHGLTADLSQPLEILPKRDGLRVIRMDMRGHGGTYPLGPADGFSFAQMATDVLALADHLGLEQFVIGGISMGAGISLSVATLQPQRVRGLILANTQAGADSDTAKLGRAEGLRVLRRGGAAAFVAAQIAKQLSPHTQATLPALSKQLLSLASGATEGGVAASLVAIATRSDHTASLRDIAVPTLLIAGADDVVTPPALLQVLADHIPGATLHVLAGAGHLSNLEAEAEFTRLVIAFLAELA